MTDVQEQIVAIFKSKIHREGSEKLLQYLLSSDFFTAPASTRFHNAIAGGLAAHSLNVYLRLQDIVNNERARNPEAWRNIDDESVAIVGLLHDVCKIDFYEVAMRNVKNEMGQWEKVPYYTVNDRLPYGHGEKSVYIISAYMRLTRDEAMAINWHMGGFDSRVKGGDFSVSAAFEQYPLAAAAHAADFMASYLDEAR